LRSFERLNGLLRLKGVVGRIEKNDEIGRCQETQVCDRIIRIPAVPVVGTFPPLGLPFEDHGQHRLRNARSNTPDPTQIVSWRLPAPRAQDFTQRRCRYKGQIEIEGAGEGGAREAATATKSSTSL
jgi:hypothetical protein